MNAVQHIGDLLRSAVRAAILAVALVPTALLAQTETLFQTVGSDTVRSFAHTSLPGATGIDFSFSFAIAPAYPPEETNILVVVFEWGPSVSGPWTTSPDNVKSVPGAMTAFFSSGVFHGPTDAPFVRIHFYAGGIMTVSGPFNHISVVPEPDQAVLLALGLMAMAGHSLRRRRACAARRRRQFASS